MVCNVRNILLNHTGNKRNKLFRGFVAACKMENINEY